MIVDGANTLIESPEIRIDRLSALIAALGLEAEPCAPDATDAALRILAKGSEAEVWMRLHGRPEGPAATAAARLRFAGPTELILRSAPETVCVAASGCPRLAALVSAFTAEAAAPRCGSDAVLGRIAEAVAAMTLRRNTEAGPLEGGLFAGLAHPKLHRPLAAIHDDPARPWTVEALAGLAGMSRSRFLAAFSATVGETPAAYVALWRLRLGRETLDAGRPVKEAARRAGYASTAAFSRAFARRYGAPPSGRPAPRGDASAAPPAPGKIDAGVGAAQDRAPSLVTAKSTTP